jgi:uncharacterized protein YecE (DUF72 family)
VGSNPTPAASRVPDAYARAMPEIRVGTCSWADQSLVKHWYPKGVSSSEARLRHYADHFDTVEVDSTYYRLPEEENAVKWAERTPDGFLFHVKAFGMMTRHPVRLEHLPPDLREGVATDDRGRVDRPPRELRQEVFARFLRALQPLRAAGKLGGILLQFPPYIVFRQSSFDYLAWAREQLADHDVLVEFRHRSWLEDENRAETFRLLEELDASHVIVDAPKTEAKNLVPTVLALTSPLLYVRFHGRNAGTWNVRGKSAAERFDYLYDKGELADWAAILCELAQDASQAFAFFNNNGRSPDGTGGWIAQAPVNALMLNELLRVRAGSAQEVD